MHSENNELAKAGHDLAKCLDSNTPLTEIAKLIARLATALDVTTLAVREATKQRDAEHNDVLVWEKTMFKVCGEDGPKSVADKFASLEAQRDALAAENAALKSNADKARQVIMSSKFDYWSDRGELLEAVRLIGETPATDAYLREVRAQGVTEYSSKRGFSFQHGSIHAHFGNGDVMVGSVTFQNGDAGINFAPVREKEGGVGTHYEWTKGKTAEQVDSVFVIASSNAEGLEVIRNKLSEAIAQLRKGGAA